jgi:acetyl-CoA carboxylase biotin carboxylase subunit
MKAGVAVVPGSDGAISDLDEAVRVANEIGYPVMIKAAAGGGGRGIRIADDEASLRRLAPQAQAEAVSAFGDGSYYLEYVVVNARHIEVQVMGDGKSAVHFFERECSLQRRRQKIWEEAPSATLDEATRQELCQSAVKLTRDIGYVGAGTVEYLYEESTGRFFFIEMNTRIQVEHPVTEAITGYDLVAEMIRIAGGAPLSVSQDDIKINGHSIEVRINAENPLMHFLPSPGVITTLTCAHAPEVRFDHFLYEGYTIPPFYDSLLGKLIVHGNNRDEAIAAMHHALENTTISGIETTIPLLIALAKDNEVKAGQVHTGWLEHWLEHNIEKIKP